MEIESERSIHQGRESAPLQRNSSAIAGSVLKFSNIHFITGSKKKEKEILANVSGEVKSGHVLAIMVNLGPSGAGKTTLISTLTLDGLYGRPTGKVVLNGIPLTDQIFKKHCYVVKQHDKHWPYLTCRETLMYAARLYKVSPLTNEVNALVNSIIGKMGLGICENTRNARLSGGQRRRLSIGVALLKQPTVLFLDEPTSGLDSAAAVSIMEELVRVAKEEKLIVVCTIHQPSTRVYNGFDKVMVLSRGREAFSGDATDAVPYFDNIGHPCPQAMNPAEFFLDLVNSDFSEEATVDKILGTWELKRLTEGVVETGSKFDHQTGVPQNGTFFDLKELQIVLSRHFRLIIRDPILYIGRCLIFLASGLLFALVYLSARAYTQDQAVNKMWISLWLLAVPSNMGVVAVYALNDEFKSVLRETKNGMVSGLSYIVAKFLLVLPIFFIFAIFALGIPAFVIQDVPSEIFGTVLLLYAIIMFVFESVAEALSVWFDNPILGMLVFMMFWFASFLFGGFLIALQDMYWPFKAFYYIMPFSYYLRSYSYEAFAVSTFEPCVQPSFSAVCVNSTSGLDVLNGMSRVFPVLETEDTVAADVSILASVGCLFKIIYIAGVLYKTQQVARIRDVRPVSATSSDAMSPEDFKDEQDLDIDDSVSRMSGISC